MPNYFKIIADGQGMGGFLAPPGDPTHRYVVRERYGNHREAGLMALDSAACAEYVPEAIRRRAQSIIDRAERVCSDGWVRMVYGYFRSMYLPESGERDVSRMISDRENTLPAERHAAVAYIRRYFPDHEPRTDLIADPGKGYGSWPCVKCGERVQYEARKDALCVVTFGPSRVTYGELCPTRGSHSIDA